ncbi:MAG TPA: hypothetical protein VHV56_13530 [Pseudolabrys sp.]|jgi:hypothetical protein|nr:hypothetical protein [Pseudolabrys sp.]
MPALWMVILASSHIVLVADHVPVLNIDPSCHAAAATIIANRNEDSCKRDEHDARAKLEQEWGQFTPAERTHCVSLSTLGGSPSYVELLTCLEMAKAVAKLPAASKQPETIKKP